MIADGTNFWPDPKGVKKSGGGGGGRLGSELSLTRSGVRLLQFSLADRRHFMI